MVYELRGKIKNVVIEEEMQDSYLSYAMSVNYWAGSSGCKGWSKTCSQKNIICNA